MKKTAEEVLQEQEQMNIYDILYPERKGAKIKDEKHIDGFEQSSFRANGKVK